MNILSFINRSFILQFAEPVDSPVHANVLLFNKLNNKYLFVIFYLNLNTQTYYW